MAARFETVYRNSFQGCKPAAALMREMEDKAEYRRKRRQREYAEAESFSPPGKIADVENKMVYRSAYQRYYRQPRWDESSVEEFQQKMQYRADRRSIEHQHQAWLWDSDDEEGDHVEEIPMDCNINKGKQDEITQTDQGENDRRKSVQAWVKDQQVFQDVERIHEESRPRNRIRSEIEHAKEDRICHGNHAEQPRESRKKHRDDERRRHRSPDKKIRFSKERRSASPSRVQNIKERKLHPPFLAYGWANDGPTEYKKTHNILASQHEVYPAALRASKRRQNVIKEKVKLHEEAIRKKELVAPIAEEELKLFSKDMWITEYQRNFCQKDDIKRHFGR